MSKQQERAAKYLALEVPISQVAKFVGVSRQTVHAWLGIPEFQALVQQFTENNLALLEDILLEGERAAAIALTELVNSEDEEMRFKAAVRLLDMRGQRGKPVDKTESKTLALKGDVNKLLEAALRDPSVRGYLKGLTVPPLVEASSSEPPQVEVTPGEQEADFEIVNDTP